MWLGNNEIGLVIFKNPKDRDLQEALVKALGLGQEYNAYMARQHNLNGKNHVVVCIMMEIPVDVDEIICEDLTTWIHHPCRAKPFLHLIKQLCLNACPKLEKFPQVQVCDRVCTRPTLHRIISIHKNKAKLRCLKIKQEGQKVDKSVDSKKEEEGPDTFHQDIVHEISSDPDTLLDKATREFKVDDKEKKVMEETIDDPLQREKEQLPEDVGEKSLPSPPT
ncbi:hypothetical protein E5676_scaffold1836G00150 [Cucumis melo var. makuwa]|uniref:Uncharacterized protein n=2 Tax=Cucumis melo TaxID=3656 RepID=A0A5D3D7T7_CUCMM|nr:hypothetical protein E5676_scaffold1836G00150 [Cucumis melo var. makuwa]